MTLRRNGKERSEMRDKKVLVTGAGGFIGSHLAKSSWGGVIL